MTDPTVKQIKFAKSLGLKDPEDFTKEELRALIDKKLGKDDPNPKKQEKPSQDGSKREFHLSPEQVRTNALMAAIEMRFRLALDNPILDLAKELEEYIWNG